MTKPIRRRIVHVDAAGLDSAGSSYDFDPNPEAVKAGFITSVPVLLIYPDGFREPATEILLTKKGLREIMANAKPRSVASG